jgi:hypothetical protein
VLLLGKVIRIEAFDEATAVTPRSKSVMNWASCAPSIKRSSSILLVYSREPGETPESGDGNALAARCPFRALGHNHIQTTAQYLKLDVRDLKEVFTRAHPRQKRRQAKKGKVAVK